MIEFKREVSVESSVTDIGGMFISILFKTVY